MNFFQRQILSSPLFYYIRFDNARLPKTTNKVVCSEHSYEIVILTAEQIPLNL